MNWLHKLEPKRKRGRRAGKFYLGSARGERAGLGLNPGLQISTV